MTGKTTILYDLEDKTPVERTSIYRKLFGFTDKSNHGKYTYQRKGLLSEIPHEKSYKSTLIVNTKHEEYIIKTLEKLKIKATILQQP